MVGPLDPAKVQTSNDLACEDVIAFNQFRVFLRSNGENVSARLYSYNLDFSLAELSRQFKFPTTPLTKALFGKEGNVPSSSSGLLTADESGRVYPLPFGGDPAAVPLLGVWIYLKDTPDNLFNTLDSRRKIWGLCSAFARCELGQKVSISPLGFEFLFFAFGANQVRCFRVRLSNTKGVGTQTEISVPLKGTLTLSFKKTASKQEAGTQTEGGEELLEAVREAQRRSEEFYKTTLAKMQEQIGLLARAVASIQQSFMALDTGDSSRSLGNEA